MEALNNMIDNLMVKIDGSIRTIRTILVLLIALGGILSLAYFNLAGVVMAVVQIIVVLMFSEIYLMVRKGQGPASVANDTTIQDVYPPQQDNPTE